MSKFGFIGASYTAKSSNIADEECINWFAETNETEGAQARRSYIGTPGLVIFSTSSNAPVRGEWWTGAREFAVCQSKLVEIASDGTQTILGDVGTDSLPVSIAASNIQLLIVSVGRAFCFTLATNVLTEVTSLLAGSPIQADYSDGYFIVTFANSNKFQMSDILDGTTWPGIQVNAVSVFPENIVGIIVSHRELWVFGSQHIQPYQDTGSDEIFDVIPGALIDTGLVATFGRNLVDNTVFWVSQDQRGARQAWRASGYTPQRISTHAVETAFSSYASLSGLVSYSYQDGGHLFWVLYIPNTDCSWVYDVAEGLWHKRAEWHEDSATWSPHRSWNHTYAFGKHLVGDWKTGNIYEMKLAENNAGVYSFATDNGTLIRRARRSPTLNNELNRVYYAEMRADFDVGMGPQPPLEDGSGNPRPPQAMLRWSNNSGKTWSNEYWRPCGMAGEYDTFVRWQRMGNGRRRLFELVVTDPILWTLTDAYLRTS